jgi:ADP-L-glycero-D-manno-heptose 6-epimerase
MILVTGGAGFIGSNIVAALAERRPGRVMVCDRLGKDERWRNLAKHEIAGVVPPEDLLGWLNRNPRPEAIVHMGAISATTETDADLILRTNFQVSADLWQWCARHYVRLIYASSAATYGDGTQGFDDDGSAAALARLRPLNAYGWSKHLFDRRVARWKADGERPPPQCVGLKFFNVYGPNEYHKGEMQSVVAKRYADAAAGREVTLFKSDRPDIPDGGQARDFVHVRDVVAIVLWLLDNIQIDGLFNVGSGQARSFADLMGALYAALGRNANIRYVDMPDALKGKYQYFTEAPMARLRAAGYSAAMTSIEEGVGDYVRRHLAAADPYR